MATSSFGGQKIVIEPAAIADFIRSPNGPVFRGMLVLGDRVRVATVASLNPGFPRNFLGPRVVVRTDLTPGGPRVLVGADKVRTRPHRIQGNPVLVFKKGGRTIFARHVNHPGSDFTRYLREKLTAALRVVRL